MSTFSAIEPVTGGSVVAVEPVAAGPVVDVEAASSPDDEQAEATTMKAKAAPSRATSDRRGR